MGCVPKKSNIEIKSAQESSRTNASDFNNPKKIKVLYYP